MTTPDTATFDDVRAALKKLFGFEVFRDGQEEIIRASMSNEDLLAVMPTGAGKSLCYQLPALVGTGLTVVVSPLIALMDNQIAQLRSVGAGVAAIHSGRPRSESVADWRAVAAGDVRLLYLSPERLMTERMLRALSSIGVARLVVDEAHCVSQWGHDFRPEYMSLSRLKETFPSSAIAAFTATADARTRAEILDRLLRPNARSFVHDLDRPNIDISIKTKTDSKEQIKELVADHQGEQGIIYCLSRKQTEELAEFLNAKGFRSAAYHAGLQPAERTQLLNAFLTEPDLIIVATIAFGMGIDKPDIRFVFHHDMPSSIESYYQEIGRAGRDGAPARAVMLYGAADIGRRMRMISRNENANARLAETRRLDELAALCESTGCRHQALLAHFEQDKEPCGTCDNCRKPPELVDATKDSLLALQAILESGQFYGASHITDILRGADTVKIREHNHNTLSAYGAGAHKSAKHWRALIRQMATSKFIHVSQDYGALKAGIAAQPLLRGDAVFKMRRYPALTSTRKTRKSKMTAIDGIDHDLFSALKAQRLALAEQRNVPAFVIFSDKTLVDMAEKRPRTHSAFEDLFGVGKAKTEAFADIFIRAIKDYEASSTTGSSTTHAV